MESLDALLGLPFPVRFSVFCRSLWVQALWNFERMQNLGFLFCLDPLLRRWTREEAELDKVKQRHLEFFNTQPYLVNFAVGAVAAMEERRSLEKILLLKESLASALAALGDSLFWASLRPACMLWSLLGLGLLRALGIPGFLWLGLGLPLLFYNLVSFWMRWKGLEMGYQFQERLGVELKRFPWQRWTQWIRRSGWLACIGVCGLALLVQPDFWSILRNFLILAFALAAKEADFSSRSLIWGFLLFCLLLGGFGWL